MPKFDIDYCKHSFIRIQIIDKKYLTNMAERY